MMMNVWIMQWWSTCGDNGIGGVYYTRESALNDVLNFYEEGEIEEDRYEDTESIHIYTNMGEFIIERYFVK